MSDKNEKLIAVKGFDRDLKCRGFQYEIGETYKHEGRVARCSSGFHSCEFPLDVFGYYPPGESRYALVEIGGEVDREEGGDTKICSAEITIKAELKIPEVVQRGVDWILARIDKKAEANEERSLIGNTGNWSAATNTGHWSAATNTGHWSAATNTGHWSAATNTGDQSAATNTGDQSAATNTGDWSAATNTGERSAATNTGERSAATNTGDWSAATNTGDQSAATNTGDWSAATNTGDWSAATNTGDRSAATVGGKDSVALASGYEGRASGAMGCALFLVERDDAMRIVAAWAGIVGKDGIEPDTFYMLKGGKPIKADRS